MLESWVILVWTRSANCSNLSSASTLRTAAANGGHNRVLEHTATVVPVILVLPVLPEIVEKAVAGVLSGQISLSMSNAKAVLFLANAVGFVALETACTDYLCVQAQQMTSDALISICLAKLADHLGLSPLLETAAAALIKLPWEKNMLYSN
ncbi:hypothetical protein WJX77_009549 [Trebouxia sp. C0004]